MANADDIAFTLRRTFNAPRELVFRTLTEAQHLQHWWGPKGCHITVRRHEERPGGIFHYKMSFAGAPGADMWGRFDYREIDPPRRIVFVNGFADEQGNRARTTMLPVWPLEVLNTVTLEERDGRTELTLHSVPIDATEPELAAFLAMHGSMEQGWGGSFDVLGAYLPKADTSNREIVIRRSLKAPRELVFEAFTDPLHVNQWWGPRGWTATTRAMDVKPGGVWRFMMDGPNGMAFPNRIEYLDVQRPARLVYRHGGESEAEPSFNVTVTFEEEGDNRTLLTMHTVFPSAEAFEEVKKYNAVEGGQQTVDRLEEYLPLMPGATRT